MTTLPDSWDELEEQVRREQDFAEHTARALALLDPDQVRDAVLGGDDDA